MKMNRRNFLKGTATAAASLAVPGCNYINRLGFGDDGNALPKPLPCQLAWQDCEVAVVYHYEMRVFKPDAQANHGDGKDQWGTVLEPNLYNPARLDTDQWLAAAKALGARYAYITPTHMNGFLQWQSDLYPYGVKQSSWRNGKGDLIREFVDLCRRYDIKPCLFFGLRFNAFWQVSQHLVDWGKGEDKAKQARYVRMCEQMMTELCTRYGEVAAVWFDGGVRTPAEGGPDALGIVSKYHPQAEFYSSAERMDHRWIGNEEGYAGYPCWATIDTDKIPEPFPEYQKYMEHGDPEGRMWCPGMVDVPLRNHDWFWGPGREHTIYPLDHLVKMYYESVGRNCTLILGVTPDRDGLVPEPDFKRMEELGNEIRRRFGTPLAETKGKGSTVKLSLGKPSVIDHVIIMEDIVHGERIRKYVVEGLVGGDKWQKLCEGISVGHKRIQEFTPTEVAKVRLRCTESAAVPKIRQLAVYNATKQEMLAP